MFWLIVVLLICVGVWFYFKQNRQSATKPVHKQKLASQKPIWGKKFVIPSGANACQAAKDIANQSFLLEKLPTLPLSACTANHLCHCHFESKQDIRSHKERRDGGDRRPVLRFDLNATLRRKGQDRRAENFSPFNEE